VAAASYGSCLHWFFSSGGGHEDHDHVSPEAPYSSLPLLQASSKDPHAQTLDLGFDSCQVHVFVHVGCARKQEFLQDVAAGGRSCMIAVASFLDYSLKELTHLLAGFLFLLSNSLIFHHCCGIGGLTVVE
jgi:hypothetical protein